MKSKSKILIVENSIGVTGALKSITQTTYDLKSFFDFEIIIPKNSRGRFLIEKSDFTSIHELPMKELSWHLADILFYMPSLFLNTLRLKKLLSRRDIELLHVNDLYNLLPVTLRLFGNETPYVCHVRFLPDRFPAFLFNFWLKLHFRYSEKVIVVSETVKQMLPDHPKIIVIHDELPAEEQLPFYTKPETEDNHMFLYLSNFMKGKGQEFALKAFAKVHQDLPHWKLRFVGGDMGLKKNQLYLKELKDLSSQLKIGHKTLWIEFTSAVEQEYKQADIVLNFSESESFSITCLEALFFGKPLIATDCGGPREIIDQHETGLLVPNRDIESMAKAMTTLATNKNLRDGMGSKARQTVREKFSVEKTSFRLKEVYDEILKRKQ